METEIKYKETSPDTNPAELEIDSLTQTRAAKVSAIEQIKRSLPSIENKKQIAAQERDLQEIDARLSVLAKAVSPKKKDS